MTETTRNLEMEERFWAKVDKRNPTECWPWKAYRTKQGYGRFNIDRRTPAVASRVAYELTKGPIPDGLQLDHLCRNRGCVNPDHLEAVTIRENILRGEGLAAKASKQTTCKWGHPFIAVHTPGDTHRRVCPVCTIERQRKYRRDNPQKVRTARRRWQASHREEIRQYGFKYHAAKRAKEESA